MVGNLLTMNVIILLQIFLNMLGGDIGKKKMSKTHLNKKVNNIYKTNINNDDICNLPGIGSIIKNE